MESKRWPADDGHEINASNENRFVRVSIHGKLCCAVAVAHSHTPHAFQESRIICILTISIDSYLFHLDCLCLRALSIRTLIFTKLYEKTILMNQKQFIILMRRSAANVIVIWVITKRIESITSHE